MSYHNAIGQLDLMSGAPLVPRLELQPKLTYATATTATAPQLTLQPPPTTFAPPPTITTFTPSPEAAPLAPEVTVPHDAREPSPQEPDYYIDPYAAPSPEAAPAEPSEAEPLLPQPSGWSVPWWAWALGAVALGSGIYIVVKD